MIEKIYLIYSIKKTYLFFIIVYEKDIKSRVYDI